MFAELCSFRHVCAHTLTPESLSAGASGLYDRARPTYPAQAHAQILDLLPPSPKGAHVVELGSGTGLFTRGFLQAVLEREKEEGGGAAGKRVARLTAVEPSEGMREGFAKGLEKEGLAGSGIEVDCVDGAFDKVPIGDGEADLVRSGLFLLARLLLLGAELTNARGSQVVIAQVRALVSFL